MRIGHIVPLIAKRYTNPATRNRALFLKGKSGIGKSQTIKQASDLLAQHIQFGLKRLHFTDTGIHGVLHSIDLRQVILLQLHSRGKLIRHRKTDEGGQDGTHSELRIHGPLFVFLI